MKPVCLITVNVKKTLYGHTANDLAAIAPNIPLLLIDSYLSSKDIEVIIIDSDAENLSISELIEKLEEINPCLIGVISTGSNPSASTMSMVGVIRFFQNYNKLKTKIAPTFILGGHPTVLPKRSLIETKTDFVVIGEGYEAVEGLFHYVNGKKKLNDIGGIAYMDDEAFVSSEAPELIDLSVLPQINWAKIGPEKYRAHNWHCFGESINNRSPYAIIWTNQGCPYPCDFCSINNVFGKRRYRFRTMQSVVEEIDVLYNKFGIRNLKILDELFIVKHKRMDEFCDLLEERNYDLNMWCFARTDSVTPEILKRLKNIGVNWVAYGFESFTDSILESTNKKIRKFSEFNVQNTIDMTRDAGMYICADVIAGLWDDDEASILKTRDFMIKNLFEWVNVYPCFAYPGTPLYKQYIDLGRIPVPTKWDIYGLYSAECNPLPTKHLSSRDVLKLRDYMFDSYYKNSDILTMIKKNFGTETHNHVVGMVEKPLKRNIISNDVHNETIGSNTVFDNSKIENWYSGELIV